MIAPREYLVAIGAAGALGRCVAAPKLAFGRDDAVVVRTDRGLERGRILRLIEPGGIALPYQPPPGELLRAWSDGDEAYLASLAGDLASLIEAARAAAAELDLPIEALDAEATLEPRGFIVHLLRFAEADLRPWTSRLSKTLSAHIFLEDLTNPAALKERAHEDHGCGSCGSEGGCGSCGSEGGGCGEGGCSTGGCGSGCGTGGADFNRDWQAYFAELREQMGRRIPLN